MVSKDLVLNLNVIANQLPELVKQKLDNCGYIVENKAKANCNVDTGALRSSITHEANENECVIGTNNEIGIYIHEGTGKYAKNGNGRQEPWVYKDRQGNWHTTEGMKPNPFLEDALYDSITEIQNEFEGMLEGALE